MDLLTPGNVPIIFIAVAGIYLFKYLRNRGTTDKALIIAQRNRVRMVVIFGVIGVGQLLWRLIRSG